MTKCPMKIVKQQVKNQIMNEQKVAESEKIKIKIMNFPVKIMQKWTNQSSDTNQANSDDSTFADDDSDND